METSHPFDKFRNVDLAYWSAITPLVNRGTLPVPAPFNMTVVVTKRCNSRCTMCYIWRENEKGELSLSEFEKIFSENDFSSLTSLTLTGGEPTLRADLPKILGIILNACPKLRQITLATSGLNTKRTVDLVQACLKMISQHEMVRRFSVQISLDGVGALHDVIRGIPGYFDHVTKTIDLLKGLAKENKILDLKLSSTIQPANVEAATTTREFAREIGLPIRFGAIVFSSSYYMNTENPSIRNFTKEQSEQAEAFFSDLAEAEPGSNIKFYYRDAAKMVTGAERSKVCMMGYYGFVLEHDGSVFACVNCEDKPLGNLLKQSFREIWWGKAANELRRQIRNDCCTTCASICYTLPGNVAEVMDVAFHRLLK